MLVFRFILGISNLQLTNQNAGFVTAALRIINDNVRSPCPRARVSAIKLYAFQWTSAIWRNDCRCVKLPVLREQLV